MDFWSLTWKPHSDKALLEGLADCHTLMGWDKRLERYVAYVRPDKGIRTIARTTSEDLPERQRWPRRDPGRSAG